MAANGLREPGLDLVPVLAIPAFDDAEIDVAPRAQSAAHFPGDMIMVDDYGCQSAYPTRGLDVLTVLRVIKPVFPLNSGSGLIAGKAQSHSVFRRLGMVGAS